MRVLIIEDDDDLRSVICDQLETRGHEVLDAGGGEQGLEMAKSERPDVVVTDIMMPGMSGFEVLAEIRRDREMRLTPVIIASGKGGRADIRRGMSMGADDYIIKPFSVDELDSSIQCQGRRKAFIDETIRVWEHRSLATIPHELRTPLNGILGISEFLRQSVAEGITLSPREWCDNLDIIRSSGYRLFRLIENHLLYHELSLAGVSHRYRELYRGQSTSLPGDTSGWEDKAREFGRGGDLSLNLDQAEIPMAEELWDKLIRELLDNAFKFSPTGSPVKVEGRREGNQYHLEVRDSGVGLEVEEPAVEPGSGLGLPIVSLALSLHGGSLELAPVPGGNGTIARISLPATSQA